MCVEQDIFWLLFIVFSFSRAPGESVVFDGDPA